MWVTAVNLGEVWYNVARRESAAAASQKVHEICGLGFHVEPADWELALQAAQLKASHPISYADCFAAALARLRNAELVTGDPEFKQVESEIKIHWL